VILCKRECRICDALVLAEGAMSCIQCCELGTALQMCGLTFELTGPLRHVAKGPE